MAEKLPQTYATHARWHPPFHFFLMPCALAILIMSIVNVVKHYDVLEAWILLVLGVMLPVAVLLIRINPLKAQDRLIRLEERLRLESILNDALRSRIGELKESQLVALRFACDAEIPGLVEKALKGNMPAKDIKKAIVTWRADTFRV
ncbi:MAG TPA: DUF6526 family protein [Bryobacteraceae bacterium]